jgi:hypothetical protein
MHLGALPVKRAPSAMTTRSALRLPLTFELAVNSMRSPAAIEPCTVPRTITCLARMSASTVAPSPIVRVASRTCRWPFSVPSNRRSSFEVSSPSKMTDLPMWVMSFVWGTVRFYLIERG